MESGQLEILFWLPTPEIFPRFRVASLPVSIHLRPGDVVLRYRRMIGEGGQFDVEPERADAWRILIARAVRNKSFVGDIQCEFALMVQGAHVEGVCARQRLR